MPAVVIWQLIVFDAEPHIYVWWIAAFFVCIAVPLSLHDMYLHAMHYVCPEVKPEEEVEEEEEEEEEEEW